MWDGLFLLLALSTVMAVASFLSGSIPLSLGLSQKHARVITAIGTGMLIGTCLIIIIPEGVETLYSAGTPHDHSHRSLGPRQDQEWSPLPGSDPSTEPMEPSLGNAPATHKEPHAYVGLSIIVGFIMMYLIDRLPKHASSVASLRSKSRYVSLADLGGRRTSQSRPSSNLEEGAVEVGENTGSAQSSATTIGLVIHAAADGIALAASSFITEGGTGLVVFLAIMIHKAPAAFGLTSVLIKQGLTKRQARAHLLVFSLAAPVGAIATWILVNVLAGGEIEGEEGTKFATGLLLLFSAGTFLYVAMHTMQEQGGDDHGHGVSGYSGNGAYSNGSSTAHSEQSNQGDGLADTLLTVLGMLLPLLAQFSHAH
ncbi:hypothetical protein FH972_025994 [Carpinus fangiana]|uniref:Zinc/iron permease n=1 Tax=Carpinus fangiana TaxID=176857 RepID=A0A5N6L2M4_9ROSI|nr:hypothetical protein FH972_025994 [Carpinus fangiana]